MFSAFMLAVVIGASASPSPAPLPSSTPAYSLDGAFAFVRSFTNGVNATGALDTPNGADIAHRADDSDALIVLTKNTGTLRGSVTVGAYSFPTVGQSLNPTLQPGANTALFGAFPVAYLVYAPTAHLTISAGKLATLLGQESAFTFQNVNVERGLGFALEPTISRGVRASYTQGKASGTLEIDDGFYSGNAGRALEGLIGLAPSAATNVQLAFIVPGRNTPGNPTSAIANKTEYDVMLTQQIGKLQLLPYALFVRSPASARLDYTTSERASAYALLANYAFNLTSSIALRYERAADASSVADSSANADLLGYGPGSRAESWTITPSYHPGPLFVRAEYANVHAYAFAPGLAFGPTGSSGTQNRYLLELGVQF